jgi:hypothetical protein
MMGDCSLKRNTVNGRVYTKNDYQYITVNTETKSKTVTPLISRSIKPGYEKDYDDWLRRFLEFERKALGYLGTTVVLPDLTFGALLIRLQWILGIILRKFKNSCKRRIGIVQDITKQPPV